MRCKHCGEDYNPERDAEWDLHGESDQHGVPRCVRRLQLRMASLEGALSAEKTVCEAYQGELRKWRMAYEALTPGGSEFHSDLDRCRDYVMERFHSGHEAKKEVVRLKRLIAEKEIT